MKFVTANLGRSAITAVLVLLSPFAAAALIHDNGDATTHNTWCSDCGSHGWMVADSFTLNQAANITSADWVAYDYSNLGFSNINATRFALFTQDPGAFGLSGVIHDTGFSTAFATGVNPYGLGARYATISMTGLNWSLAAGTYWFGAMAQTPTVLSAAIMPGVHSSPSQLSSQLNVNTGHPNGSNKLGAMDFKLYGDTTVVPELDAAALPLGIGLVLALVGLFRERAGLDAVAYPHPPNPLASIASSGLITHQGQRLPRGPISFAHKADVNDPLDV